MRSSKTVNGVSTRFVYDGMNIISTASEGGFTSYTRGTELISFAPFGGESLYFQNNSHGDVTALLTSDGTEKHSYLYNAYGKENENSLLPLGENMTVQLWQAEVSADNNPFRYCGEYCDDESGLIYLRNRYYDPSIGRFISEDPARDGLNWYAYCGNNPVNCVDPWGLYSVSDGKYSSIVQKQLIENSWKYYEAKFKCTGAERNKLMTAYANSSSKLRKADNKRSAFDTTAMKMENNLILADTKARSLELSPGSDEYGIILLAYAAELNNIDNRGEERYNQMMAILLLHNLSNTASNMTRQKISSSIKTGEDYLIKPLGRGSTGRTEPKNLNEKLAMEEVMSNPLDGASQIPIKMNDKRWLSSDGWVKMQRIVNTSKGDITVHFTYNSRLNVFDDFKFK